MKRARLLCGLIVFLMGCGAPAPQEEPPSWKVFALKRYTAHDGLAVVNQPDGYGSTFTQKLTRALRICRPRWLPDQPGCSTATAHPFSSALPRVLSFAAVERPDVIEALQTELQALCLAELQKPWEWIQPPLTPSRSSRSAAALGRGFVDQSGGEPKRVKQLLRDLQQNKPLRSPQPPARLHASNG